MGSGKPATETGAFVLSTIVVMASHIFARKVDIAAIYELTKKRLIHGAQAYLPCSLEDAAASVGINYKGGQLFIYEYSEIIALTKQTDSFGGEGGKAGGHAGGTASQQARKDRGQPFMMDRYGNDGASLRFPSRSTAPYSR